MGHERDFCEKFLRCSVLRICTAIGHSRYEKVYALLLFPANLLLTRKYRLSLTNRLSAAVDGYELEAYSRFGAVSTQFAVAGAWRL